MVAVGKVVLMMMIERNEGLVACWWLRCVLEADFDRAFEPL